MATYDINDELLAEPDLPDTTGLTLGTTFDPTPFDDNIASGDASLEEEILEVWLERSYDPDHGMAAMDDEDDQEDYFAGEVPPLPLAA